MKILIAGTPGVGKTTFSSEISRMFGILHVDVSKYIKDYKLYEEYDEKFDTLLFDESVVSSSLSKYLSGKSDYVIDTHSPELVSFVDFTHIYVLKVSTNILYKRLQLRGYDQNKIKENINCEIFEVTEDTLTDLDMPYKLVGDNFLSRDEALNEIRQMPNDA